MIIVVYLSLNFFLASLCCVSYVLYLCDGDYNSTYPTHVGGRGSSHTPVWKTSPRVLHVLTEHWLFCQRERRGAFTHRALLPCRPRRLVGPWPLTAFRDSDFVGTRPLCPKPPVYNGWGMCVHLNEAVWKECPGRGGRIYYFLLSLLPLEGGSDGESLPF